MCLYEVQVAEVFASQCLRLGRAAAEGSAIRKSTCFQRVQELIVLNSSGMCSMDWPVVCAVVTERSFSTHSRPRTMPCVPGYVSNWVSHLATGGHTDATAGRVHSCAQLLCALL